DSPAVLEEKAEAASSKAMVDFALWGALRSQTSAPEIAALLEAGVVGFKAYLGYAFRRSTGQIIYAAALGEADLEAPPDYGTLARLAPVLAGRGALLAVHAEDPSLLRSLARPLGSYEDLLASRPALAEAIAVAALGEISREA